MRSIKTVAALVLAALLAGCAAPAAPTTAPPTASPTETAPPATEEVVPTTEYYAPVDIPADAVLDLDPDRLELVEGYQYGNMQVVEGGGNYLLHDGKVFFWANERALVYSYDAQTGALEFAEFPEVPYLNGFGLEVWDGSLYCNTYRENIIKVDGGKQPLVRSHPAKDFCHYHEQILYEAPLNPYPNTTMVLSSEDGEEFRYILKNRFVERFVLIGDYLFFDSGYGGIYCKDILTDEEPQLVTEGGHPIIDGEHIYFFPSDITWGNKGPDYYLYRCDLNGDNAMRILSLPVMPASLNFDDEYLYFRLLGENGEVFGVEESSRIYRMPKDDPGRVELIATLPAEIQTIFTVPELDLLFVTVEKLLDLGNGYRVVTYVMNSDGSGIRELELIEYR